MIFVSMTSDELLARTAQYQIQYSSARRRRRNRRTGMRPSHEYLTAFRPPLQSLERTVLLGPDSNSALDDNENADRNANDSQAEFRVTTEYEDSEDNVFVERDDDDEPSIAEVERVEGEDDLCSDSEESVSEDEDNEDTSLNNDLRRGAELQRRAGPMRRQYSDPTSGRRQPLGSEEPSAAAAASGSGGMSNTEVLKPHARFFIEREKSMVSIKFDPPPYVIASPSPDLILTHPALAALSSSNCGVLAVMAISIYRVSSRMATQARASSLVAVSDNHMHFFCTFT